MSVLNCPAYTKNAVNGMVSPSESRSITPSGKLAHAQNTVKRLQERKCLFVPGQYNTSYYDVLGARPCVRERENIDSEDADKGAGEMRDAGKNDAHASAPLVLSVAFLG